MTGSAAMPPVTAASRIRRLLQFLLVAAVPLIALGAWFSVQDPDSLVPSPSWSNARALMYDEFDLAAMALRGLNAERGRRAGRMIPPGEGLPSTTWYAPLPIDLEDEPTPEPRYFLEYPHAALVIFRAGYWVQPSARDLQVPPSVLDCDYHKLVVQRPKSPEQEQVWSALAGAARFYACLMVLCQLLLIGVLWYGYGPETGLRGGVWLLLLPAALYFTLNRFDVLPALLTAVSFACLGRGWRGASAIALGLAILVKVYPILFVPLILRYLWPDWRSSVRWGLICAATGICAFAPLLAGADLHAVLAPYQYQLPRPPEFGLTFYGCILPEAAADGAFGKIFRLGALGLTALAMMYRPIPDMASLLRRCAVLLLVFVSLAVFFSPQWIVWFVPLLAPLVATDRRLARSVIGLDLIMYLTFPIWYWMLYIGATDLLNHLDPLMPLTSCAWDALVPGWPVLIDSDRVGVLIHRVVGGLLRGGRFLITAIIIWQLIRAEWPGVLNWTVHRLPRFAVRVAQWV